MPAPVDKLHDELMNDPDFYPDKTDKQKDAIAWAIAWSKHNKNKKKKSTKKSFNMQEYRTAQKADE
jgi:hypothetical protein